MAVLQFDVYARTMGRTVTFDAYVPSEALKPGETCKTLYLLHGVQGSYLNWITATDLFRLTAAHNATCVDSSANGSGEKNGKRLAIIMPSAGNGFYHRIPYEQDPSWTAPFGHKHDYEKFVGEELVEITRNMLPLSREREDTAIAGLSMGGYGAFRTALLYPETFGFAGGLSNALITRYKESMMDGFYVSEGALKTMFGDFEAQRFTDREDVQCMLEKAVKENTELPRIYVACGKQDPLRILTQELCEAMDRMKVPYEFEEKDGGHEWAFWEWGLERILSRL